MKIAVKIYFILFMLLTQVCVFAQPPTDDAVDDLQDEDPPAMFISRRLIWVVLAAIALAFYKLHKLNREQRP